MNSFNGTWVLDNSKNSNLTELLKCMGRSDFEISCVASADENFTLHIANNVFSKNVDIFLNNKALQLLAIFKSSITRVQYQNTFVCDGKVTPHPNDQKRFGNCDTVCYIQGNHILIRWYLNDIGRIMISDHHVSPQGQLIVTISLSHPKKNTIQVVSTKFYNRS